MLALSFVVASPALAQELVGKYSGSYTGSESGKPYGMAIQITSAESGKLKGTLTLFQKTCSGTFPIEGAYTNNKLEATAAGSGRTGDCLERKIEAVVEGNRLVGKLLGQTGNWVDINLSK